MVENDIASEKKRETSSSIMAQIREIGQNRFVRAVFILAAIPWLLWTILVVVITLQPVGPSEAQATSEVTIVAIAFLSLISVPILLGISIIVALVGRWLARKLQLETNLGLKGNLKRIEQNRFARVVIILTGIPWLLWTAFLVAARPSEDSSAFGDIVLTVVILSLISIPILLVLSIIVAYVGRKLVQALRPEPGQGVKGIVLRLRQHRFLLEVVTLTGVSWLLLLLLIFWVLLITTDPAETRMAAIILLPLSIPIFLVASAIIVFLGRLLIMAVNASGCLAIAIGALFGVLPPLILYLIVWINIAIANRFYIEPPMDTEVVAQMGTADVEVVGKGSESSAA